MSLVVNGQSIDRNNTFFSIESVPLEILEKIIIQLVRLTPIKSESDISATLKNKLALACTCKRMNELVNSPTLTKSFLSALAEKGDRTLVDVVVKSNAYVDRRILWGIFKKKDMTKPTKIYRIFIL